MGIMFSSTLWNYDHSILYWTGIDESKEDYLNCYEESYTRDMVIVKVEQFKWRCAI